MRLETREVPFSPDGPLTWGEIDVVRTDVFNPALIPGLLPPNAVKPGATWKAAAATVAELTDMEKVEEGAITVEFVGLTYGFSERDFRERVIGAARVLRLAGEVSPPAGDDLVALAAHGTLQVPRSALGRRLAAADERDEVAYWLRKLVFRSAWIDSRLQRDLLLPLDDLAQLAGELLQFQLVAEQVAELLQLAVQLVDRDLGVADGRRVGPPVLVERRHHRGQELLRLREGGQRPEHPGGDPAGLLLVHRGRVLAEG